MIFSAQMYLRNYEMVSGFYEHLGFPTWIIYPSAILKLLGVVAILTKVSPLLKEWAYAGFFFDMVLALAAHQIVDGSGEMFSIVGLIAIVISRIFENRVYLNNLKLM